MKPETLPVIFRKLDGEVTAYFPTMGWTLGNVPCYAHIGQHSGACPSWLTKGKRATPEQYRDLLAELTAIYAPDYTLKVYKRRPAR